MKRNGLLLSLLLLATTATSQNFPAVPGGATSVAWRVPVAEGVTICWNGKGRGCCSQSDEMIVLARMSEGKITRVRTLDGACDVRDEASDVHWLDNVSADASIDFLAQHLEDSDHEGSLVGAIAMHDSPRIVPLLQRLARRESSQEIRKHAIFWLGQKAGAKAAAELRRAVDEDPDDDVRLHAVFAISQLPKDQAVPILAGLARTHKSPAVRKRAIFWLAQTGDDQALAVIEEILAK